MISLISHSRWEFNDTQRFTSDLEEGQVDGEAVKQTVENLHAGNNG